MYWIMGAAAVIWGLAVVLTIARDIKRSEPHWSGSRIDEGPPPEGKPPGDK